MVWALVRGSGIDRFQPRPPGRRQRAASIACSGSSIVLTEHGREFEAQCIAVGDVVPLLRAKRGSVPSLGLADFPVASLVEGPITLTPMK